MWGVLSYGLLGAVSGLLVDWRSGDSTVRNYRPAFFLMTACGFFDLLLSAVCLKVRALWWCGVPLFLFCYSIWFCCYYQPRY